MKHRPVLVYVACACFVAAMIWASSEFLVSVDRGRRIISFVVAGSSLITTVSLILRPQFGRWLAAILFAVFCIAASFLVGAGLSKSGTPVWPMILLSATALLFGWLANAFSRGRTMIDYSSRESR